MLIGKPPYELIVPAKNRVSFIYCEYGQVLREDNSLVFRRNSIEYDLPVANTTALLLGTGTSITQPAAMEISRWGCNVSFVKGGGIGLTTSFQSTVSRSTLLQKQAKISSSPQLRLSIARKMYAMRWGEDILPKGYSIRKMMTFEGQRMRAAYRKAADLYGYDFQRVQDYDSADPINQNITYLYSMLYDVSSAFIVSLGLSPGLGIIHYGHAKSFVFDVADFYKEDMIALAFECAHENIFGSDLRKYFRAEMEQSKLREKIVDSILTCLGFSENEIVEAFDVASQETSYLWNRDELIDNKGHSL